MQMTTEVDPKTLLPVGNSFKKFEPGPAIIKPSIVHEPNSQIVSVGSAINLIADATGTLPLSYEWNKNGHFVGVDSSRYYVASASLPNSGVYKCTIANAAGHVETHPVSVTVGIAPSISIQPSGQSINAGQAINLSLTASGDPSPNYQWKKGGTNVGTDSSVYTKSNAQVSDSGIYKCSLSNIIGSLDSTNVVVAVAALSAPVITLDPVSQDRIVGDTLSLTVAATGTATLHYQWKKGISNVGTDSTAYSKANIQLIDAGLYKCIVTNVYGSADSSSANITVAEGGVSLAIFDYYYSNLMD
jgi:hypothetical protein